MSINADQSEKVSRRFFQGDRKRVIDVHSRAFNVDIEPGSFVRPAADAAPRSGQTSIGPRYRSPPSGIEPGQRRPRPWGAFEVWRPGPLEVLGPWGRPRVVS